MIASTRDTTFARQFSSVSLVHRMETNIERQFFEVCPFIFAVQQDLPDALTKCLPSEVALNSPPMANKNHARRPLNTWRRMCDYVHAKHARDKISNCLLRCKGGVGFVPIGQHLEILS